jgi:hypothetical protein
MSDRILGNAICRFSGGSAMWRSDTSKQYAIVLAQYVETTHQVPPSILTERSATELMLEAIRRNEPIERTTEQRG